jgi:hypothetical protein
MNNRTAYIRRSRKGLRLKKRALAVALLSVAACTGLLLQGRDATVAGGRDAVQAATVTTAASAGTAAPAAAEAGPRRVYPYSIVAGGVAERAELARIIQTDKVVASHYASFEVAKAHPVTVAKARAAYVSYRKGDDVYWTAKKVMLAEGETLLSDGKSEIRGRCGNRISEVAMLPVEAAAPSEEELDAAVEEDGQGGALQVAAPFIADGAGRSAHQLLTYPNGAGLLAVSGGDGWRGPASIGVGAAPGAYPGAYYGTPTALTGGSSAQVETGGSATVPAADTAPVAVSVPTETAGGAGSTSETPHAGTGGATSETPRGPGSVAGTIPSADGGSGGLPTPGANGGAPLETVTLPVQLSDTVQPEPEPDVKAPTIPETVLSPAELPAVPVQTVETSAVVPEPATPWLAGAGAAALLLLRRRKRPRA